MTWLPRLVSLLSETFVRNGYSRIDRGQGDRMPAGHFHLCIYVKIYWSAWHYSTNSATFYRYIKIIHVIDFCLQSKISSLAPAHSRKMGGVVQRLMIAVSWRQVQYLFAFLRRTSGRSLMADANNERRSSEDEEERKSAWKKFTDCITPPSWKRTISAPPTACKHWDSLLCTLLL